MASPSTYRHNSSFNFRYEKVRKPYLGPRKLAAQALSKVVIPPITEEGFLDHLLAYYPLFYNALEWVRFHQFEYTDRKGSVSFRIAIISLLPDPQIRDLFFQQREEITVKTGWYPLVQGSRAKIHDIPYRNTENWRARKADIVTQPFGTLNTLLALKNSDQNGSSFLVNASERSILLDTGMGQVSLSQQLERCSFVFVSHYHRDHSEGIWEIIHSNWLPFVMSQVTLAHLCSLGNVPVGDRRELARTSRACYALDEKQWITFLTMRMAKAR